MTKQDISAFYNSLQNLHSSQNFLENCYATIDGVNTGAKSYENSGTFMYYLDQGQLFLTEGKKGDIRLKPLLYFYGMGHIIKACLLTNRPNYPESTSILAHGVSARKRKKKDYTFIQDEVKVQQNGLFTYSCNYLFSLKTPPITKVKMDFLFRLIPEMNDFFAFNNEEKGISIGRIDSTTLCFPISIIDNYHLTERAFIKRISTYLPEIKKVESTKKHLLVRIEKPIQQLNGPFYCHWEKQEIYFPCDRTYFVSVPEILIHYLLLYNLSMISRYETEYWGELFATKYGVDYSIIVHYLTIVVDKVENLLGEWLQQRQ
ncbi:YaaC family protein [Virgibacillus necropolis]|uniref:YaaC family protein n=1 Tax=Virgibacillus necropolis TaxID=163877 RepID=UPI00384D53F6